MDEYSKSDEAPDAVISNFLREVRALYRDNLKNSAYFNAASEIVREFVDSDHNEIPIRNIRSIARSQVPKPRILSVLSEARIIEQEGSFLKPGELAQSILRVQWEMFPRNSDRWERRIREVYGLLVIALTITLVRLDVDTPRSALAVFHMVSKQVIAADSMGEDQVDNTIPQFRVSGSFSKAGIGAQSNIERDLLGFNTDGQPKIVKDVNDDDGAWIPKEISMEYMNRVLERWRDRDLDREIVLER